MQFSPGIFLRLFLLMVLSTSAWSQEKGALAHGGAKPFEIVFEPVAGRFFRLVSDEAAGNDRYANVADLQLLQAADGQPISRELWSVFESSNGFGVDSESSLYAIDEDLATAWKSHGEPPHHIDIDLHQTIILAGFRYLPNLETDGAIHKFSVFVSDDGVQWGNPVMRGTLVPKADGLADETRMGAPDPIDLVRQEFTSSGMVYGPVAIDVDHRNRVYVAETYRYDGRGVIDNRGKTRREEDDLQTNSLEERRGFLNAWLADGELQTEISAERNDFKSDGSDLFTKYSEKVALLEDRDGDGRADHRKIVAEGFNDMLAGAGAGVLVRGNDIYFACIPSIWRLTDTDGDDVANEREEISRGYGIRTGWFGHDLHGLTWGPDGRLYFSMADRGFDVRTKEGNVYHGTNTGAVFRCWPDGSDLEMVAKGMRNPQELAFDDLGYLFTGDNNCDAGDRARLVYVVDGGDSGWRVSVQSLADRGPWLGEAMWELPREEEGLQPAWIVPPLAHLNSGPSGMAHYPGTGLPESYRDYFFLCDYRGGRGSIQSFRVKPKGASFSLSGHHTFHDGPTVSDVAFGYDGKVYASEWGPGWGISEHASIYTLTTADPKIAEVRDVQTWFGHGFKDFDNEQLGDKLGHGDQRVRYEAQRVLADRKAKAVFVSVLAESSNLQLARLHAVWGLGQLARQDPSVMESLVPYFNDADPEVRGRVLELCGHQKFMEASGAAMEALGAVNHPRLRFHAAYAVGKLRPDGAQESLMQLVQSNHDADPYLRHAAVMGLTYGNNLESWFEKALNSESEAVRLAAVLVLRRLDEPRVSQFLGDASMVVATEAARAIYDREITGGIQALAESVGMEGATVPYVRRSIHANFQLGSAEAADRLCQVARADTHPKEIRQSVMELLLAWDTPPNREGVWGRWRPLKRSVAGLAKSAVRTHLQDLLELEDRDLQGLAQRLDALYGREKTPPQLAHMASNPNTTESLRIDALLALEKIRAENANLYQQACEQALAAPNSAALRAAAVQSWARVHGDEAVDLVEQVVQTGATSLEKQAAVRAASTFSPLLGKRLVSQWMTALVGGKLDPQIQLDVFDAAESSGDADLLQQTQAYREQAGADGIYGLSLYGGDTSNGQILYETNLAAQCVRCHSLRGKGGDVGPPLDGLAGRHEPQDILQSVINPQAEVALGYGIQTVTLRTGDLVTGTLVSQNKEMVIISQDGEIREIPVSEIAERSQPVSGMPPAGLVLKPRELRDLLAFLQTLD